MAKSLQEQLLKAGVANRKQAVRGQKALNRKQKSQREGSLVEDEAAVQARDALAAKVERDRELNREQQRKADERAIQAQIRELITLNRLSERGEVAYSFTDGALIKSLSLRSEQRKALIAGSLAIARLGDSYELIPRQVAEKIGERDQSVIIVGGAAAEPAEQLDDAYADFQVPDDLMW